VLLLKVRARSGITKSDRHRLMLLAMTLIDADVEVPRALPRLKGWAVW
jgi:hypothetical protein